MPLIPRLCELADRDTRYLTRETKLSFLSAFIARRTETVHDISIPAANLLIVLEGTKRIGWGGRSFTYAPGAAFAMPPGASIDVINEPDSRTGVYRALLLGFSPDLLLEVQRRCVPPRVRMGPTNPTVELNDALASAVLHTCEALSGRVSVSERVTAQRTQEVLMLLGEMGAAVLQPDLKTCGTADAIRLLVRDKPAHDWTAGGISRALGMSESTLRRNLRLENTTFRDVVAAERMRAAHAMLEQGHRVTEAALAAGYASPSHFARRFLASYGCLPSRLADTTMRDRTNRGAD